MPVVASALPPEDGGAGSSRLHAAAEASNGPAFYVRLTKRSEFLAAAGGRRFHTPRMTVQSTMRSAAHKHGAMPKMPAADVRGIRVGLTVTRKVGHATERNRIRRRLREAVRAVVPLWPRVDLDLVIIARRDVLSAPFPLLVEDLTRAVPALISERRPKAGLPAGRFRGKGHPSRPDKMLESAKPSGGGPHGDEAPKPPADRPQEPMD